MQRSSVDQNDRTATEVLLYADPVVIPSNMPGAIVSQRWVRDLINAFMPIGMIIIWSGSIGTIPAGWALCNGQVVGGNVTPNLSGRFVLQTDGGGYYAGLAGGNYTHAHGITVNGHVLTWGQMPYHNHGISDPTHTHGQRMSGSTGNGDSAARGSSGGAIDGGSPVGYAGTGISILYAGGNEAHSHSASASTESLMPPFYTLCYIMKVASL